MKGEVHLMLEMVRCLDAFSGQQSRLIVVVDGLDSCEQSKVLSVLDAVQTLFSDPGAPFIILLAIDPHVIIKAIELNLSQLALTDTSIGGNAYLRNLVHLPFFLQVGLQKKVCAARLILFDTFSLKTYDFLHKQLIGKVTFAEKKLDIPSLQNSGLRKVKVAQAVATQLKSKSSMWLEVDDGGASGGGGGGYRKLSSESNLFRKVGGGGGGGSSSKSHYGSTSGGKGPGSLRDGAESIASSIGGNINKAGAVMQGPQVIRKKRPSLWEYEGFF